MFIKDNKGPLKVSELWFDSNNSVTSPSGTSLVWSFPDELGTIATREWVNQNSVSGEFLELTGGTVTGLINYSTNLTGQTSLSLLHQAYADSRYAPVGTDSLELLPVISQTNTPPTTGLTSGDRYLVGTSPINEWSAQTNNIATWGVSSWSYTTPVLNNVVYVTLTLTTLKYDGDSWESYKGTAILQNGNSLGSKMYIGTNDNFSVNIKVNNDPNIFEFDSLGRFYIPSTGSGYLSSGIFNRSSSIAMIQGSSSLTSINGGVGSSAQLNLKANSTNYLQLVNNASASNRRTNFINPTGNIIFASFHNGLDKVGFGMSTTAPTGRVDIQGFTDNSSTSSLILKNSGSTILWDFEDNGVAIGTALSINTYTEFNSPGIASSVSATDKARLEYDSVSDRLRLSQNGSNYENIIVSSDLLNYVNKTGDTMTGTLIVPTIINTNITSTNITGGTITGGKTYLSATGDTLTVVGTTSGSTIFRVQGTSGELFSINDNIQDSLYSINNISGLPVLEVFSNDTILMGNYLAPSLNTTSFVTVNIGTSTLYSLPASAYTGAFYEYTVNDNTNLRAGTIMAIWSGSTIVYNETPSTSIGNTTGITIDVIISSNNVLLRGIATTNNWKIKTIIRSI